MEKQKLDLLIEYLDELEGNEDLENYHYDKELQQELHDMEYDYYNRNENAKHLLEMSIEFNKSAGDKDKEELHKNELAYLEQVELLVEDLSLFFPNQDLKTLDSIVRKVDEWFGEEEWFKEHKFIYYGLAAYYSSNHFDITEEDEFELEEDIKIDFKSELKDNYFKYVNKFENI